MSKKKALKISLILIITGIVFIGIAYITFHFVGQHGFEPWSATARKPLIAYMCATFSLLNIFGSLIFLLVGLIKD